MSNAFTGRYVFQSTDALRRLLAHKPGLSMAERLAISEELDSRR